jgi:hypothetical protein
VESEVFIDTLVFSLAGLVNIKYCPLLVVSFVVAPDTYCSTFLIFASLDVKDFAVLPVDKLFILILEDLPPS